MENLGITLGVLLLINEQLSGDHHQNVTISRSWLSIQSGDSVNDFLERQGNQLLDDILSTLKLSGLKRQHGLVSVQVTQLVSVLVELLVVKVTELGGNGVEVDWRLVNFLGIHDSWML